MLTQRPRFCRGSDQKGNPTVESRQAMLGGTCSQAWQWKDKDAACRGYAESHPSHLQVDFGAAVRSTGTATCNMGAGSRSGAIMISGCNATSWRKLLPEDTHRSRRRGWIVGIRAGIGSPGRLLAAASHRP